MAKEQKRTIDALLKSGRKSRFVPREFDLLGEGDRYLNTDSQVNILHVSNEPFCEVDANFAPTKKPTDEKNAIAKFASNTPPSTDAPNIDKRARENFAIAKNAAVEENFALADHEKLSKTNTNEGSAANVDEKNAIAKFAPAEANIAEDNISPRALIAKFATASFATTKENFAPAKSTQDCLHVAFSKKLHPTLFVTYAYLNYRRKAIGATLVGLAEVAEATGMSKRTVQENFKELLQLGLIGVTRAYATAPAQYELL